MRLPFAVHTATEGYGWTAGLSHGHAMLERMRRAVGKTPDFDYGASACCGAVNDGDTVTVYRFMRAEKWDSSARSRARARRWRGERRIPREPRPRMSICKPAD